MGKKEKGICVMAATVSFALVATRTPCVAQERFIAEDGHSFRQYFRFVPWPLWRWLRRGGGPA